MSVLWNNDLALGITPLAGADEAGRGPLAGPVVAAAVILREPIEGLNDSKKLSEKVRERLFEEIVARAEAWKIVEVSAEMIDRINILQASLRGMREALEGLSTVPKLCLVDGNKVPVMSLPVRAVVKGDGRQACIAAASILAKVHRDRLMVALHEQYPVYDFLHNKGYPTSEHLAALRRYGPCPAHRATYGPVAQLTCEF